MSDSEGPSFSRWILVRVYGGLTAAAMLTVVASFAFESVVNRTTALAIAGLWVFVTVYGLVSRLHWE